MIALVSGLWLFAACCVAVGWFLRSSQPEDRDRLVPQAMRAGLAALWLAVGVCLALFATWILTQDFL